MLLIDIFQSETKVQQRFFTLYAYFTFTRQARTQGGGGVHWVHVHPPPPPLHLGKTFHSEMSKRGEKVPPTYVGKKECARSA